MLGNALDVGFDLLSVTVDLLELVPVPGLAAAAKTLLTIWESVQQVDVGFILFYLSTTYNGR